MQPIIFDMDGVLVDSEPIAEQHFKLFFAELGIVDELPFSTKGRSSRNVARLLIETFNLEYTVDELVVMSRKKYREHLNALPYIPEIPGAKRFVKSLAKNGHPLALASSASPERIAFFLKEIGLTKYFPVIACGEDVEFSKPAPDIFLLAAKKLGVDPKNCVVVEDAENGVRAAKAAGMMCIAYNGSDHNTDNLLETDLIVKDFDKLVEALKPGKLPV